MLPKVEWLLDTSPCALRTVSSNEPKPGSVEQRNVYCRAKQGDRVAHAQKTLNSPMVLRGEVCFGKIEGEGCRVCDFLLIG